jgi:CBS domain-containing protein
VLVVVGGVLVGIVTATDLVRLLARRDAPRRS